MKGLLIILLYVVSISALILFYQLAREVYYKSPISVMLLDYIHLELYLSDEKILLLSISNNAFYSV